MPAWEFGCRYVVFIWFLARGSLYFIFGNEYTSKTVSLPVTR